MIKKQYWPNGNTYRIEYFNKNSTFYHRLNGPAYQIFYKSGFACAIEFWENGKYHSLSYPAQASFDIGHKISWVVYMIKNKNFDNRLDWKNKIKRI